MFKKIICLVKGHALEHDSEIRERNGKRYMTKEIKNCNRCSFHEEERTNLLLANPKNKWGSLGLCYGCKNKESCEYSTEKECFIGGPVVMREYCPINSFKEANKNECL